MPELNNIQTYEKLNGTDFKPSLDRFERVLRNIDLWNKEIEQEIRQFEWKIEDNGFVYSSITQAGYFETKYSDIKVRPLVMAYTPAIDSSFTNNWINCELLIETSDLRNVDYFDITFELIGALCFEMFKEFKQTGIYFTDEVQDGQDFDGIRINDNSKLWQFDYALIPIQLREKYSVIPTTHDLIEKEDYFIGFQKNRWAKKPNR